MIDDISLISFLRSLEVQESSAKRVSALWALWDYWPINPSVLELWFWVLGFAFASLPRCSMTIHSPFPLSHHLPFPWTLRCGVGATSLLTCKEPWKEKGFAFQKWGLFDVVSIWLHLMEDVRLLLEEWCGLDNGQASLMRVTWPLILEVSKMINLNEFCYCNAIQWLDYILSRLA